MTPKGKSIQDKLLQIRDSCQTEEDDDFTDMHVIPIDMFFELEEQILPELIVTESNPFNPFMWCDFDILSLFFSYIL